MEEPSVETEKLSKIIESEAIEPEAIEPEAIEPETIEPEAIEPEAIGSGMPETLAEAEELAASIQRAVDQETGHGVRGLCVEINGDGVLLRGRCRTYYCKQLAQHAAMAVPGGSRLTNSIEVS